MSLLGKSKKIREPNSDMEMQLCRETSALPALTKLLSCYVFGEGLYQLAFCSSRSLSSALMSAAHRNDRLGILLLVQTGQ